MVGRWGPAGLNEFAGSFGPWFTTGEANRTRHETVLSYTRGVGMALDACHGSHPLCCCLSPRPCDGGSDSPVITILTLRRTWPRSDSTPCQQAAQHPTEHKPRLILSGRRRTGAHSLNAACPCRAAMVGRKRSTERRTEQLVESAEWERCPFPPLLAGKVSVHSI